MTNKIRRTYTLKPELVAYLELMAEQGHRSLTSQLELIISQNKKENEEKQSENEKN